jgi:hypothetical protein
VLSTHSHVDIAVQKDNPWERTDMAIAPKGLGKEGIPIESGDHVLGSERKNKLVVQCNGCWKRQTGKIVVNASFDKGGETLVS